MKDRLVKQALEQLARSLGERNGDGKVHIGVITEMVEYLRQIQQEHKEFKREEENAILFGRKVEMADIRNSSNMAMRVVPVTQEEFKLLRNNAFVAFLSSFGIRRQSTKG